MVKIPDSTVIRGCNGQLHYPPPADIDRPLNEAVGDKICDYRADYNNAISFMSAVYKNAISFMSANAISFMSAVASASGGLHCELVRIFLLPFHRKPMNRHTKKKQSRACLLKGVPVGSSRPWVKKTRRRIAGIIVSVKNR